MCRPNPPADIPEKNSADTDTELRHLLLSCMAETLTSHQYQVFVLNFLEGMPQKEIAQEFNLSPSAVSRCLTAAKLRLRKALGYTFSSSEDYEEEDPFV